MLMRPLLSTEYEYDPLNEDTSSPTSFGQNKLFSTHQLPTFTHNAKLRYLFRFESQGKNGEIRSFEEDGLVVDRTSVVFTRLSY